MLQDSREPSLQASLLPSQPGAGRMVQLSAGTRYVATSSLLVSHNFSSLRMRVCSMRRASLLRAPCYDLSTLQVMAWGVW